MPWLAKCKRTEKLYPNSAEAFQLVRGEIYQLRKKSDSVIEIIIPFTGKTITMLRSEGPVYFEKPFWKSTQ